MPRKHNRVCRVCGAEYYYCPSCMPHEPAYKTMFCADTCKVIWEILSKHGVGKVDAQTTLEALCNVDMPSNFTDAIKKHIDMIEESVCPMKTTDVLDENISEEE